MMPKAKTAPLSKAPPVNMLNMPTRPPPAFAWSAKNSWIGPTFIPGSGMLAPTRAINNSASVKKIFWRSSGIFSEFVKATYAKAKNKRLSISNLVEQFNDKAGRSQKYEAIQLLLDIASADEKLHREEEKFINKIVKTTGINLKTFKEMKNKVIANIGNIDTSEETSEEMFGITSDMNKAEKCKLLRKEYTKWNAQTTHKELKRRKRAKQLVKIVADLRKKYKC